MIRVTVKLFLIFILVYTGVNLWYGRLEKRLFGPPSVVSPQVAQEKPAEKTRQVLQKTSNYKIILTRNIFEAVPEQEKVDPQEKEPVKVEEDPEETTLKLVLHGTVSGIEQDARAIIVNQKDNKQDIYQIGDTIQGALITSIERGKVILELKGEKQLLLIKEPEGGGGGNIGGAIDSVSAPRKSRATIRPSRTDFPKKASTPTAVPHRRISLRQDSNENEDIELGEHEEPEEPLVEEDLVEGDLEPTAGQGQATEPSGGADLGAEILVE